VLRYNNAKFESCLILINQTTDKIIRIYLKEIRAGEPERPEPHDLVGAGAILFFSSEAGRAGARAL